MKHPLEKLSTGALRRVYWGALLLTALVPVGMDALAQYRPEGAGSGVATRPTPTIKFEFANTPEAWNALATDVGTPGLQALRRQTYLDMLFMFCYSTAIAAGAIGIARGTQLAWARRAAPWVAWGGWLSGALDGIENVGMLVNIAGPLSPTWLTTTAVCATVKFGLVGVGIVFVLFMLPLPWRDEAA